MRGVWRDLYGAEPEAPPPYTPDWGETGAVEHMLAAACRHLVPVAVAEADAGDVHVFRLRPAVIAKHAAILTSRTAMIHAQSERPGARGHHQRLVAAARWRRRSRFPGVDG